MIKWIMQQLCKHRYHKHYSNVSKTYNKRCSICGKEVER